MSKINQIVILWCVAASLLCVLSVNAQDSSQGNRSSETATSTQITTDRASNTRALTQISMKIKENENKETADISEKIKAEQAAQAKLRKTTEAATKAELALSVRISAVERAERRLQQMSGNPEQVEKARSALEKAEKEKEEAQRTTNLLADAKQSAEQNLNQAIASRAQGELTIKTKVARRAQQQKELIRLNEQWGNNPTEDNLITLSDQITSIACEEDAVANPFWKTSPEPGATLYYQSLGERKRNESAHPINNPTRTQQTICFGRYYVWAERFDEGTRQNKVTSDKNKRVDIFSADIPEVVVLEHH
jgi:hypothetical protein